MIARCLIGNFSRGIAALMLMMSFVLCAHAGSAAADLAATRKFDIAPQQLPSALLKYSEQSGIQITGRGEIMEKKMSTGVSGNLTARSALERLLKGTDLVYQVIDANTVAISAPAAAKPQGGKVLKTSAVDTSTLVPAEMPGEGAGADAGERRSTKAAQRGAEGVEEMLVEGEREKPAPFSNGNLDLTRTEDDVLPFTVFNARDIELSGAASLQEFFQNRLAQNFNADIPDELDGYATGELSRVNRVNMRGWGDKETVFLLNGRRMPAVYQGAQDDGNSSLTPNLRAIPLGLIERIEILPSAGSAIYGEGATGGVINIITRRDFRGGQVALGYQTPADAHRPARNIDVSYGALLKWGMNFRLGAGYSDQKPALAKDRADVTIERWRRLTMARAPNRILNAFYPPFGATPNIKTADGSPLLGDYSFTSVPAGYMGTGGLTGFEPGVYNLALADGAAGGALFAKNSALGTTGHNTTLTLGLDKSFGSHWELSLEYNHAYSESAGQASGELYLTDDNSVPATAANNPFQQEVFVMLIDPAMERLEVIRNTSTDRTRTISSSLRAVFGEWRGVLDLAYSDNRNVYPQNGFWEPTGGWRNAFITGAYNPFVDPRVAPPAAPAFYEDYIAVRGESRSAARNYQAAIKLSGPIARLPAGAVQLTSGLSGSRVDRYESYLFLQWQDARTGAPRIPTGRSTDIIENNRPQQNAFVFDNYAAYAELNAPLVASGQPLPLIHSLEVFGSANTTQQSRSGYNSRRGVPFDYEKRPFVYAVGLRYEMLEGLALRVSQSIGFRPPSIVDVSPLDTSPLSSTGMFIDPLRPEDGQIEFRGPEYLLLGGNIDLRPETTDSVNFGLTLTPQRTPGLRVMLNYLHNVRNDAISTVSAQMAVDLEPELPQLVRRGPPDGHPSGVGRITFLDLRTLNFNMISSRSLDLSVEQRLGNVFGGRAVLSAAATRNLSFKVQAQANNPPVEQVRNPNGLFAQQIEWNANGQLRWEGRRWGFGWAARFYDYVILPTSPSYVRVIQGGDRVDWKVNHDLNVSYGIEKLSNPRGLQSLLSGASFSFGVKNVFDREPRFWARDLNRGVAPYDSIMGRSVWLRAARQF